MTAIVAGTRWMLTLPLLLVSGVALWVFPHPVLLFVLPMAIFGVYLCFRSPFLVCLGFILFSFFRLHEAFPVLNPLRIPQLLAMASFAVLAWHIMISNSIKMYWSPLLSHMSVLFVFVVVSGLLATNRGEAIGMITGTYSKIFVMILAIAWLTRREQDINTAAWAFIGAGVLIALVAISNKLNGIGLVEGTRVTIGRNIGSMIGDPNDLALVLTFPLSFAVGVMFTRQQGIFRRMLAATCYALICWGIIATQSRGGLLGILSVTGIAAWRNTKNKVLLIVVGGLVMSVLLVAAGISDRASGGASEDGIDESAMGRIYAWGAAWNMALAHPVFGVGINNFYSNYYFYSDHWDGKNHAVHSTWFQVLAETGFVGFVIFVSLVIRTIFVVFSSLRQVAAEGNPTYVMMAQALLSGLIGFCVTGTFLTQGFIWPLYILLALTIALTQALHQTTAVSKA
jgi:putative inorganic carbon (HCO3(-)) transporter